MHVTAPKAGTTHMPELRAEHHQLTHRPALHLAQRSGRRRVEHSTHVPLKRLRTGAAAALLALAGCATQPPPSPADSERDPRPLIDYNALRAGPAQSPWDAAFAPAEAALAAGDWKGAQLALPPAPEPARPGTADTGTSSEQRASTQRATAVNYAEFEAFTTYVLAHADFIRGDLGSMQQRLQRAMTISTAEALSPGLTRRLLELQLRQEALAGAHLAAADTRCRLLPLLGPRDAGRAALARALWLDLQHAEREELRRAGRTANDPECAGWIERVLVARGEDTLEAWQQRHPEHPALQLLPPGVGMPPDAAASPRRVALLLPLGGRIGAAGAAVRDGFMAAYFSEAANSQQPMQIRVFDTTTFADTRAAYQMAITEGADLVVGPLTKQGVDELLEQSVLPVPVIALNRRSDERAGPAGSVQFALSPEDEARQLARRALAAGHRRALLLRPAGDWGNKLELALREVWEAGGGQVAAHAAYGERSTHSESIKTALGLYQSEQRARAVRQLLGQPIETGSRRRRDLDVIFMLAASTAEAKSLGPLLAYHYAGDLPRYATSAANSAEVQSADRDLEGLQLVEMPWLLDSSSSRSLRASLQQAALEPGANLSRLHALGADAFRLAWTETLPDPWSLLRGVTGTLSANTERQIERELPVVKFERSGLQRL